MKVYFVLFLVTLLVIFHTPSFSIAEEYKVGQVWAYHTRKGEENSKVTIVKIDDSKDFGKIYHISVAGLNMKTNKGIQHELQHSPVSNKTLDASVTKLIETKETLPDFTQGYNAWKEAFDAGKAGVFDVPVAEIITTIESFFNKGGA
jgi:hypothetical protein